MHMDEPGTNEVEVAMFSFTIKRCLSEIGSRFIMRLGFMMEKRVRFYDQGN